MIRYLKGLFRPAPDGSAIIETASGIGFRVFLPAGSRLYRQPEGSEAEVMTSMVVGREGDVALYGFPDKEDLELFELLITVSGVGAKVAMSIMSSQSSSELRRAIAAGDVKAVSRAQGIGRKTAERLILELKDKVGSFTDAGVYSTVSADIDGMDKGARAEAIAALISLGYSRNEAADAVVRIKDETLTTEEYIKQALKRL